MFNPVTTWQDDTEYRISFLNQKAKFSSDQRLDLQMYRSFITKMLALKLDPTLDVLLGLYPDTGRPAKNQSQIIRSCILFTFLLGKNMASFSLTAWVRSVLPNSPLFIALVGCSSPDQLPPLGSYYDFMHRLWNAPRNNFSRSALLPAGKNSKKPKKELGPDDKLIDPEPESHSTVALKNSILSGKELSNNPEAFLEDFFYLSAVLPSLQSGLIDASNLTLSGDGTAVAVHASPFGHRQKGCDAPANCPYHSNCPRHYSDPDADWGWDSHEKVWFFGRTLYMLCSRTIAYKTEVPILMKFLSAKRHDSICFFYSIDELGRHMPGISPKNMCLDSAHDNIATYELLKHWDINALIDINSRNSSCDGLPDDISIDKSGHVHCMAGHTMCSWGYDKIKEANKYRCPLVCGRISSCSCKDQCSSSSYGRTVHIKVNDDLRHFPSIPRDSNEYRKLYAERTACERVNNRVLNDYHLLKLKIRGDCHYSYWTLMIGICLHLDARAKAGLL